MFHPRPLTLTILLITLCLIPDAPAMGENASATEAITHHPPSDADRAALEQLCQIYERAAREGDVAALKPHLAPHFSAVMVTHDAIHSYEDMESYLAKIRGLMGPEGHYTMSVHVEEPVIVADQFAFAHGSTDYVVTTSEKKEYAFTSLWTAVTHKADDRWKILRVHASMDPIFNPFVKSAVVESTKYAALVAAAAGLIVGLLAYYLWGRWCRRKTA